MLFVCVFSFAQTGLHYGVRLGAGFSDSRYTTPSSEELWRGDPVLSHNEGVYVGYDFLRFLGVEAGVVHSSVGYYDKDILDNKVSASYIQLPVMLRLSPLAFERFALTLELGAYASYGVYGKLTNEVSDFPYFGHDRYATAIRPDYGLVIGGSLRMFGSLLLGARIDYGLCNVASGNSPAYTSMYNESASVTLGWEF